MSTVDTCSVVLNTFGDSECGDMMAVQVYLPESANVSELIDNILVYNPCEFISSLIEVCPSEVHIVSEDN